jgi:hypothetical protein
MAEPTEPGTLVARSAIECHLYIELHPCTCGEPREPGRHRLESRDSGLVAVYGARCQRCGTVRHFEFVMDDEIAPLGSFGGSKPSQIIDAGEFLAVADSAAQQVRTSAAREVPADISGLDDAARHRARLLMKRALAAIEEVLKFIRPGEESVSSDALFSARGATIFRNEPARFRKARLQAVRRAYQDAVAKL